VNDTWQNRLSWLASIVESSDDAIVGKNLDGVITSWNKGAERVFGYTAEEAVDKSITILIPPDRRDEERMILERIKRGEHIDHFETIREHTLGSSVLVSLTISPVLGDVGSVD
jgi:PAS domain S-box-containing protein